MTTTIVSPPTPSQWASASLHFERRADWRTYRVDGERYVVLPSGRSAHVYQVRADAAGCSCPWYQRTGQRCSHMLALELAALEAELSDAARGGRQIASPAGRFLHVQTVATPSATSSSMCSSSPVQ